METENDHKQQAEQMLRDSQQTADTIAENLKEEIRNIEKDERQKLLDEVDHKVEEIRENENREIEKLEGILAKNRETVLKHILNKIIPGWDGAIPEWCSETGKSGRNRPGIFTKTHNAIQDIENK